MINPSSLLAFGVVVVFALLVESGISTLFVVFSGLSPARVFFAMFAANATVYILGFRPLLEQEWFPLWLLECGVVGVDGVDAAAMKFISQFEFFQGEGFLKLGWISALLAGASGNAFSYFIGRVAGSPF